MSAAADPAGGPEVAALLQAGRASGEQALALFDRLPPVDLAFMLGAWRGEGFDTGHPLDGLLEICHWHGKRFESPEAVHPLVFRAIGGGLVRVDPRWMGPGLSRIDRLPPRHPWMGRLFQLLLPLLRTRRSRARLRMTEYRGCLSATMLYDQQPINDVFRRIDDDTVFGLMDLKGMERPFFFILRRESGDDPSRSSPGR